MKLITKLLAVCGAGLAMTSISVANQWINGSSVWAPLSANPDYIDYFDSTYTGSFKITPSYNPALMYLTSAEVYFGFFDEDWNMNTVGISLNSVFWDNFNGNRGTDVQSFSVGGSLSLELLTNLSTSGELNYSLQMKAGKAILLDTLLVAYGEDNPPPTDIVTNTPDAGATFVMVILGLVGLIGARKSQR